MRDTVGHIINKTEAEALKAVFHEAAELLKMALIQNAPGPSLGNKKFPAGTLKAGIFVADGPGRKPNVLVGVGRKKGAAYLGIWNEFGTKWMRPNPFFRRSVNQTKPAMAQIIARGIRDAVGKAAVEA
jgi:HK97 gp10 family phage protein